MFTSLPPLPAFSRNKNFTTFGVFTTLLPVISGYTLHKKK
jgi:hypothetical protein